VELSQVDLVAWRRHRPHPSIIEQPGRHVPGRVLAARNKDAFHAAQGVASGQLRPKSLRSGLQAPAPQLAGSAGSRSWRARPAYSRRRRLVSFRSRRGDGWRGAKGGRRVRSTSAATGMAIGTEWGRQSPTSSSAPARSAPSATSVHLAMPRCLRPGAPTAGPVAPRRRRARKVASSALRPTNSRGWVTSATEGAVSPASVESQAVAPDVASGPFGRSVAKRRCLASGKTAPGKR
jgi:hypothetical protein